MATKPQDSAKAPKSKKTAKPAANPYPPVRCTVCSHAARQTIDLALINGASLRPLAAQFGLSASALSRHTRHIRAQLLYDRQAVEETRLKAAMDKLELWEVRLDRLFSQSESSRSLYVSLGCIQEYFRLFALKEKLRRTLPRLP